MARTKKVFSVVEVDDGDTSVSEMGEEELRAFLAERKDDTVLHVFAGPEVKFEVATRVEVTLGEKRERKSRAAKPEKKPKKGTTVSAEFFEKPTNGASAAQEK